MADGPFQDPSDQSYHIPIIDPLAKILFLSKWTILG